MGETATKTKTKTKNTKNTKNPFAGCEANNVTCEWLDDPSEAQIVRLVVDDERWHPHSPNATYQQFALETIRSFVAAHLPDAQLIVCPAGMVTVEVEPADALHRELEMIAQQLTSRMQNIHWGAGPGAVLLGVDGTLTGMSTPIQSSMLIEAKTRAPNPSSLILKMYPAGREAATLVGWQRVVNDEVNFSDWKAHQCLAGSLKVVPFICHEAASFARRSVGTRVEGSTRTRVADYLSRSIKGAQCIAMMIHWLDRKSGPAFLDAARQLAELSGVPVAVSAFAPHDSLEIVAKRFEVNPPRKGRGTRVATLLVRDAA